MWKVNWYQERPPDQASPYNLARSLHYAERFDEAYEIFDSLVMANPENTDFPYVEGADTGWRARIAAVWGDAARAASLLHRALGEGAAYGLQLHRDPEFESLRDYPPFKELMRPEG